MNAPHAIADFLPHSIAAEQALLGATLINNDAYNSAADLVEPSHFFEPLHERLWTMIGGRISRGERVTPVTLTAALGPDAMMDVGGMTVKVYMARLMAEATTVINAPDFARTIRDMWARRRLINFSRELQARALGGFDSGTVEVLLEEAEGELSEIRFGKVVQGASWIGEAASRAVEQTAAAHSGNGVDLYETGIQTIDKIIGPLIAGDFITLLGESGSGKTAIAMQIMRAISCPSVERPKGAPSAFISQEMGAVAVARRQMSAHTGISTRAQRSGAVNQAEFESLYASVKAMHAIPIIIDESGRQKISGIIKKLRSLKKLYGIKAFAIDHSRLLRGEHSKQNEIEIITNAAMELKEACKSLELIGIMLAQPSRDGIKSAVRWRLTDQAVYGGDALRQNSDMVLTIAIPHNWLINREPDPNEQKEHDKWMQDCLKWKGLGEFCAIKLRDGEKSGWETLIWSGSTTRFGDR